MLGIKEETRAIQKNIKAAVVYAIFFGVTIATTSTCLINYFVLHTGSLSLAIPNVVLAVMNGYLASSCISDAFRKLNS